MPRLLLSLLLLSTTWWSLAQERCCGWFETELMSSDDRKRSDSLTFAQSLEAWEKQKLIKNDSYRYLIQFDSNSFTQIEVVHGKIQSRKHFSYGQELQSIEWTCEPSYRECSYTKTIDSLRNAGSDNLKDFMAEHIGKHTVKHWRPTYFNCWEEYDEFVGDARTHAFDAQTLDDLYVKCQVLLSTKVNDSGSSVTHEFTTDRTGIASSCYLIQPFYSSHGDQIKEGFEISAFEWIERP